MFRCKKCKKIDDFTVMISPSYRGSGNISYEFNENEEIIITVDGYKFIPDLAFMNSHAACRYCGEIKTWEYYFPKFHTHQ